MELPSDGSASRPYHSINEDEHRCRVRRGERPCEPEVLECADMSALWFDATCRVKESGDVSPHGGLVEAERHALCKQLPWSFGNGQALLSLRFQEPV